MSTPGVTPRGSDRLPRLAHARVADVMHPGVVSCPADTDLTTVARMMASHHIHAVVVSGVVPDDGEKLVWSLLSDFDLVAARDTADYREAGELAHTRVLTVEPEDPLERAAHLMVEHRLSHLLVVSAESGQPVGVLSTLDVAGAIAWGEG